MRDNIKMDPNYLREATRAEHEATEAVVPLMGSGLTLAQYVRVLACLWPIVESWETWAAVNAPKELGKLLQRRCRASLLAADIRSLRITGTSCTTLDWNAVVYVEGSTPVDEGEQIACVLGAMYVMEGSTLGGRLIARSVEEHLHIVPGEGDSYFRGHGEATGMLWREFRDRLTEVSSVYDPLVENAAKRTFRAFAQAFQSGLNLYTGAF